MNFIKNRAFVPTFNNRARLQPTGLQPYAPLQAVLFFIALPQTSPDGFSQGRPVLLPASSPKADPS